MPDSTLRQDNDDVSHYYGFYDNIVCTTLDSFVDTMITTVALRQIQPYLAGHWTDVGLGN